MKYAVLLVFLASCSSNKAQQLSKEASEIEVVVNKPSGCTTVGKVKGTDKSGSRELALNQALNEAAKLEATTLHVNQEVPNGGLMVVHATAYKCE